MQRNVNKIITELQDFPLQAEQQHVKESTLSPGSTGH